MLQWRHVCLLLAGLVLATPSPSLQGGQTRLNPDAPFVRFEFPVFNEEGYLRWMFEGEEGQYLPGGEVAIKGMTLTTYPGNGSPEVESTIVSPEAVIVLAESRASGKSLQVEGEGFRLRGREWQWFGREERLVIREGAAVEFEDRLIEFFQ